MGGLWLLAGIVVALGALPGSAAAQEGDGVGSSSIPQDNAPAGDQPSQSPANGDDPAPVGAGPLEAGDTVRSLPAERTIYTPADFAAIAPRNAQEMLQNVPGFRIEGESQGRGLGQASGNVLINGERATSKTESIFNRLSRIPASSVVRIELVDGSTLNIPGLSGQVANVVVRSAGMSGRFEWRPQWTSGVAPFRWSQGDASISGNSGRLDYSVALRNDSFYNGSAGTLTIIEAGGSPDPRFNVSRSTNDSPRGSVALKYDLGGDARANLNLSAVKTIFRSEESKDRTDLQRPSFSERLNSRNDVFGYEISGDIEFPFGPGRLKLIGLGSADSGEFVTQSRVASEGRADTGSRFVRGTDEGEQIARGEYSWQLWGADWQLSLEGAFNQLENSAELFRLDADGAYVPFFFPGGSGGVREDRYEAGLSFGRPLAANLALQVTVAAEHSTIVQSGANALARTFKRPKGSLSLAWAPAEELDLSLRVARRVGQLSFGDFLASVNLTDNNSSAGNNRLRPQQTWEVELEGSRDFGAWGSATLKLFHHMIEDYITIIPILTGGEARGNIATAVSTGVDLNATVRLEPVGVQGAKIDVRGQVERSRLPDPVTGISRPFDRARAHEIAVDFRHDVPNSPWAYGGGFRQSKTLPYYRVSEVGLDYFVPRAGSLFVEHKDLMGLTARLNVANLFGGQAVLERSVFAGPRDTARLLYRENRYRDGGQTVSMNLSGSF